MKASIMIIFSYSLKNNTFIKDIMVYVMGSK